MQPENIEPNNVHFCAHTWAKSEEKWDFLTSYKHVHMLSGFPELLKCVTRWLRAVWWLTHSPHTFMISQAQYIFFLFASNLFP